MPLKIWTYFGFIVSFAAFCYGSYYVIRTLIFGIDDPGYASLLSFILFFVRNSINWSWVLLGEYLSRVFIEVKQRPLYLVREIYKDNKTNNKIQNNIA